MDSGCTNHMTRDKELFTEEKLTQSSQKYITFSDNNKGKVFGLGKVAIFISILIKLCLFDILDIISCLYQSYVIWVCLLCFLLLVVLCFHRMIIHLSSRAYEKEI